MPRLLAMIVTAALGLSAWAQHVDADPRPRGPGRMDGGASHAAMGGRWFERIADDLALDDEQRVRFDAVTDAYRERMREMGPRWREVRQAAEAGDMQRAAELREQARASYGDHSADLENVFDQIEPFLRDDQLVRLNELRADTQRRRESRDLLRSVDTKLPNELNLDDEQRAEFERLLAEHRREVGRQPFELGPIFEELRAANDARDVERLAALEQELQDARPDQDAMFGEFLTQLEGILHEEQKPSLAAFRDRIESRETEPSLEGGDVRNVLRAAKRLKLRREQRDELRQVERSVQMARRELGRRDKEAPAGLAADTKKRILGFLDKEQAEQFEQYLRRLEQRTSRRR